MLESYPIIEVNPAWSLGQENPESMGSKEKFWFQLPDDEVGTDWLFKFPRPNTGEHWAEKVAAEVAKCLDIPHAQVELAVCQGERGSVSKSFVEAEQWLLHGNECLSEMVLGYQALDERIRSYDLNKRYHQSDHNLATIFWAFEHYRQDKTGFAEYLLLDAVIGNTDRHHENWGFLLEPGYDGDTIYINLWLAPSFDHASSLGRELLDDRRARFIAEGRVGGYSERGTGGIYWSENDKSGPSPLELLRRSIEEYPQLFRPGLAKLSTLDESSIVEIVNRIPDDWMTNPQRDFATALMRYNLEQLRKLA